MNTHSTSRHRGPEQERVAVVDDDPTARRLMRAWLENEGYQVEEHESGQSAVRAEKAPAVACVDLGLGDMNGLEVLRHLKARDAELPLIVVTAHREIETAVEAMRAGAYDYVTKPLDRERLIHAVRRASERRALLADVQRLESELCRRPSVGNLVGESRPMQDLFRQIELVSDSDVAVCVSGESGTGKELVARAIHAGGARQAGPFVAINCAAIPESLQESELFGHERGAFTGATQTRRGRFEQANGGTLFLDELGEMSAPAQASLLRTLQEKTIRRVGGADELPIDVRIIAATHRDLKAEVRAGRFREDLFFRLVVYPIVLPPLRDRSEDIPVLVGHFLRQLREDAGRSVTRISPEALNALARYGWPGNVRELMNVVHRSTLTAAGDEITLSDLPREIREFALPSLPPVPAVSGAQSSDPGVLPLRELERRAIARALRVTGGSVGKAAKLLGIGRATLYRRLATSEVPRGAV